MRKQSSREVKAHIQIQRSGSNPSCFPLVTLPLGSPPPRKGLLQAGQSCLPSRPFSWGTCVTGRTGRTRPLWGKGKHLTQLPSCAGAAQVSVFQKDWAALAVRSPHSPRHAPEAPGQGADHLSALWVAVTTAKVAQEWGTASCAHCQHRLPNSPLSPQSASTACPSTLQGLNLLWPLPSLSPFLFDLLFRSQTAGFLASPLPAGFWGLHPHPLTTWLHVWAAPSQNSSVVLPQSQAWDHPPHWYLPVSSLIIVLLPCAWKRHPSPCGSFTAFLFLPHSVFLRLARCPQCCHQLSSWAQELMLKASACAFQGPLSGHRARACRPHRVHHRTHMRNIWGSLDKKCFTEKPTYPHHSLQVRLSLWTNPRWWNFLALKKFKKQGSATLSHLILWEIKHKSHENKSC